ncbi:PX domain-containing protein kinase-like protein [Phoenix dactylifera]|uniref:PX domain-containing protein kinase-like protein n=1 Tax=Phoenix dactylifera TaxID=42345 RepID=A0A8B7D2Z5_PHODC|nr:PX domain-containing protein kinase-like protein [Phoenix dactylifera]
MAVTTDSARDDDEWEICNDNGFVYKRRRRRRTAAEAEEERPPPSGETEAELRRHRRDRRRRCLLGLREKYRRELEQWETLSFTLLDLTSPIPTAPAAPPPPSPPPPPPEPPGGALAPSIDDLLSQVESQEAILRKVSEICDSVELVCKGQEERLAESLISLPIWGSPRSLIASLSD